MKNSHLPGLLEESKGPVLMSSLCKPEYTIQMKGVSIITGEVSWDGIKERQGWGGHHVDTAAGDGENN